MNKRQAAEDGKRVRKKGMEGHDQRKKGGVASQRMEARKRSLVYTIRHQGH